MAVTKLISPLDLPEKKETYDFFAIESEEHFRREIMTESEADKYCKEYRLTKKLATE